MAAEVDAVTLWTNRTTPTPYRYATRPKQRPIQALDIQSYLDGQNGSLRGICEAVLERTAYFSSPDSAYETIFKQLPPETAKALGQTPQWIQWEDYYVRYYSNRNEAVLSVRKGNRYGCLINGHRLTQGAQVPIVPAVNQLSAKLRRAGLPHGDYRTVGNTAAAILDSIPLPARVPPVHNARFNNSFRGCRFEAATFGQLRTHDYDLTAAYPYQMSRLLDTAGTRFIDSTDLSLAKNAIYAAVLCDITVSESLPRGPVAVRVGEHNLYFPVGKLKNVWLNLPEVRFAIRHPEVERIDRVKTASWCIPSAPETSRPYQRVMRNLFRLREANPQFGGYIKSVMVSCWGKLQSSYQVDGQWVASKFWNPALSSHITSSIRVANYEATMGNEVHGEFIDGFATSAPMPTSSGFGALRCEGEGEMMMYTDTFKQSSWKPLNVPISEHIQPNNDDHVTIPLTYHWTLKHYAYGMCDFEQIGQPCTVDWRIPLGSTARMHNGGITAQRILTDQVTTRPPTASDIALLELRRIGSEI